MGSWGVKGHKIAQNDKKFCPLHSISQEPYIIWLSFMVYICKIIMSSRIFFHFYKSLTFWIHSGLKGRQTIQNDKKLSDTFHISGTIHHVIVIYGANVLNANISRWFFQCKNFDCPVFHGLKWRKLLSVAPYISESYIIWSSFMVHLYI